MPVIRISPEELDQVVAQFRQHVSDFESHLATMQSQIASLEGNWEGMAQQAFSTLMERWTRDYSDMLSVLNNVNQLLSVASSSFREGDQEAANKLNQIMG